MALKFKTRGASESALSKLIELSQYYEGVESREKSGINSSLDNILKLSQYATNEDSLANIKNQWESQKSNASEYEETNVYYDLIGNVLQDRGAQINQYSDVVDQAQGIVSNADFLDKGSEFENLPQWVKGQVNDEGKPKYESVMDWVQQEYARVETISNTLDSGSKLGFRRGKGIDDVNIQTQMNQYKTRLNTTLEALMGDEAITAEEAQLIIAGDRANFKSVRDKRLNEIGSGVEEYDEIIQKFDDETIIDDLLEEADIPGFEGFSFGDATESERKAVLKTLITERDKRIDNYEKWSGRQYAASYKTIGDLEKQDFENAMGQEFDNEGGFTGEKDKQDIELEKFEELSPQEQKTQIEEKKKIGQEQYEESIKKPDLSFRDTPDVDLDELRIKLENELPQRKSFVKSQIKDVENRLKEKQEILDGNDKASISMNKYLLGELNQAQALSEGAWGGKESRTEIIGRGDRKKIREFQIKFQNSGLTIDNFIAQNQKEYYEMTKILKYGKYWFKKPAAYPSEHYINLYD